MKMFLFWTRGPGLVSWLIRRVTGGDWQHVGVRFDRERERVYYEAHAYGEDKGFRGPKPLNKLLAWARQPGNVVEFQEMDIPQADIAYCLAWCEAEANEQRRGYDVAQLLRIWVVRRLKWLGLTVANDPRRVCCHEAVIRMLHAVKVDFTSDDFPTADSSDPGEVRRAFERWKAARPMVSASLLR